MTGFLDCQYKLFHIFVTDKRNVYFPYLDLYSQQNKTCVCHNYFR